MLGNNVQIFVEATLPVFLAIVTKVLLLPNSIEDSFTLGHLVTSNKAGAARGAAGGRSMVNFRWIGAADGRDYGPRRPAVVVPFPPEVVRNAVRAPDPRCDAT